MHCIHYVTLCIVRSATVIYRSFEHCLSTLFSVILSTIYVASPQLWYSYEPAELPYIFVYKVFTYASTKEHMKKDVNSQSDALYCSWDTKADWVKKHKMRIFTEKLNKPDGIRLTLDGFSLASHTSSCKNQITPSRHLH